MTRTRRRRFLEQVAAGAALSAAAPALASAGSSAQGAGRPPGSGPYDYLGRTPGYKDWAVVPRGLTVKSVETFQRESLALVRITASDGKVGMGPDRALRGRHLGDGAAPADRAPGRRARTSRTSTRSTTTSSTRS